MEELRDDQVRDRIVYSWPRNTMLVEQPRVDVEGPLAPARLLDEV